METVKVAVLGCGRIGKLHGTNLVQSVPQAEVVAVADPFMNDVLRSGLQASVSRRFWRIRLKQSICRRYRQF